MHAFRYYPGRIDECSVRACSTGSAKAMMALPLLALFLPGTSALDNGVGRTPIMGFDAWCAP